MVAEGETAAFAEDAGFNLFLGRDVVTNPTQLLNLYNNNAVDLTEMLAMLDAQAFDTIVLRAQFYPPPVLDMIGQRYTRRGTGADERLCLLHHAPPRRSVIGVIRDELHACALPDSGYHLC